MRLDVALECGNHETKMGSNHRLCKQGSRAGVARPSLHERIKIDESQPEGTPIKSFYELSYLDVNSIEPSLKGSSSSHRRSVPTRSVGADMGCNDEVQYRGSMYHSSRDIRKLRKRRDGKRNAVLSQNDDRYFSFEIVDTPSLTCQTPPSLLFPEQASSPLAQLQAASKSPLRLSSPCCTPTKIRDIFDISFRHLSDENSDACDLSSDFTAESSKNPSASILSCFKPEDSRVQDRSVTSQFTESGPREEQMTRGRRVIKHENDKVINLGKAMRSTFFKSFSVKVGTYDSPCQLGSTSAKSKSKTHIGSPKMLNPAMKSKSMRNPTLMGSETSGVVNKSLLNDLSQSVEDRHGRHLVGADRTSTSGSSSPAHLHGSLRLGPGHGSSFEFSLKDPELLSARLWKMGNSLNSVYTFHKRKNGRRSNSMVGQMHMSCYLYSEVNEEGTAETFLVMEFVLYDIARERMHQDVNDRDSDASACYPWTMADLNPYLEVAAIVIRVPFNRSNGLINVHGSRLNTTDRHGLLAYSSAHDPPRNPVKMKVVTPSGRHGLPNAEGSPSTLLDRWRSGGGCDCGGWDMACPIVIFENSGEGPVNYRDDGSNPIMPLFFQGRKEELPALSIQEKGSQEFSVVFHAQLSAMQAFAICIAMLYSSETSLMAGEEVYRQMLLHPKSLKFLLEEELRLLVGAAAVAKGNESANKKGAEQFPPLPFAFDPPFSLIGRV